jgi:hypothetical protein
MNSKKITNWVIMGCIVAAIVLGLVYGDMSSYMGAFRVSEDGGSGSSISISSGQTNIIQVVP